MTRKMEYYTLSFDRNTYFRVDGTAPIEKNGHFLSKGEVLRLTEPQAKKLQHAPACAKLLFMIKGL